MQTLAGHVAGALLDIDAVGFAPQAPIRFQSGILSPVYVDNRCLPYHPAQWHTVIEGFRALIAQDAAGTPLEYDVIGGIAVGGVPHSAALAYLLERPSVFVRQEAKAHGRQQRVEGGEVAGRRVLLVEDLVTTGGSSLRGVDALREEGARVEDVLAIVSYGFPQATAAFAAATVRLHTLTTFAIIVEEAAARGAFGPDDLYRIQDWLDDPPGWAERHGYT